MSQPTRTPRGPATTSRRASSNRKWAGQVFRPRNCRWKTSGCRRAAIAGRAVPWYWWFQVDEIPATDMGDVTLQSPSPIQKMADRLRQRVTGMQRASAFRQAEQGAATQREAEMGLLARAAMQERETPSLVGLAGWVRQRLPDILGEARAASANVKKPRHWRPRQQRESRPSPFLAPVTLAMVEAQESRRRPAAAEEPAEIQPEVRKAVCVGGFRTKHVLKIRKDIQGKGYQLRKRKVGGVSVLAPPPHP